jgi:arylsulfatase A-like enzyme
MRVFILMRKIKYILAAGVVVFILFWIIGHWYYRNSHIESKYFIRYFPFASRSSVLESSNAYLNKCKLEEVNIFGKKAPAIRFPIYCNIDYCLKIPKNAELKIFLKHYGPKRLIALEEFKIGIQEENKPLELLQTVKFPKGFIKNEWRTEEVSLHRYRSKIVRLSFSTVRHGGVFTRSEGFFFRPLLMLNKHSLQSQRKKALPVPVKISPEKLRQTNVIIIILDAARPDHFSCYGYNRQTTPYIDQFAKQSVIFKNAFSVAPYTIASTTSLFTSLYPDTHRITRWQRKIPEGLTTVAEIMKQNNYDTYGSGFIMDWAAKGFKQIFDFNIYDNEEELKDSFDTFLQEKFAHKKSKPPAFIYIHLKPPHADYNEPEKFDTWSDPEKRIEYDNLTKTLALIEIDKGARHLTKEQLQFLIDKYDGNLLWGDWLVHLLLEGFKKYGLFDNSLIIVTADHGEAFREHNRLMHNSTVYTEMIKIPLIIKFPAYIKPNKKIVKANVENIDLMPTLLDFLQIELPDSTIQGNSLLPVIFGEAKEVKPFLFARGFNEGVFSLYDSKFKYIQIFDQREFYNVERDPQEKVDLASSHAIFAGYYRSLAYFYQQELRKAHLVKPAKAKLDEETIAILRSLGYLQ